MPTLGMTDGKTSPKIEHVLVEQYEGNRDVNKQ